LISPADQRFSLHTLGMLQYQNQPKTFGSRVLGFGSVLGFGDLGFGSVLGFGVLGFGWFRVLGSFGFRGFGFWFWDLVFP
jgi:hypothetical protein